MLVRIPYMVTCYRVVSACFIFFFFFFLLLAVYSMVTRWYIWTRPYSYTQYGRPGLALGALSPDPPIYGLRNTSCCLLE